MLRQFLAILASLTSALCTWLISEQNLAPGFVGTDGWTITGSYCDDNRYFCSSRIILGGYGCFGAGSQASRWFNIAHHWQVRIQIAFWMLDSWDDESLVVIIAGDRIQQIRNLADGTYICGASWKDEVRQVDLQKQNHYERDILVQFSSTLDQDPTDESWGITDFTISVEPCNPTCNQCQGQDAFQCLNCWANADFIPYSGALGFCVCQPGFYTVSKDVPCKFPVCSQCMTCDPSCETCSDGNAYSCVKCKSSLWKQYYGDVEVNYNYSNPLYQKTLCVSNCIAPNYYQDVGKRECLMCYPSCQTCNSQLEYECLSCYNGYYLDGDTTGKCVTTCVDSYYKDDTDKKCKKCNSNCLLCLDNQPNFCSKCKNGSYLTITTGICVSDCGVGQWEDKSEWKCKLCDPTCYNCDLNATNCTQCTGTRYLYQNQCLTLCPDAFYQGTPNTCQPCSNTCKTCDQASITDCLSCSPSYGFLKDRQCIKCPENYYGDSSDQTCKQCDLSCWNCDAGTATDCISCVTNYLEERQCKPSCKDTFWGNVTTHTCDLCDPNCFTCKPFGPNNDCLTCSSPLFLKNLRCIPQCNIIQEYGDEVTRKCTACDSTCYKCNQKLANNCTECTGLSYLYNNQCLTQCPGPQYYGLINNCIAPCPDAMYGDDASRLCLNCDPNCPTCFGSGLSMCNSCLTPYYLEGTVCQLDCPSNKYKNNSNRKCTLCNPQCLECDEGTDSDCTKCESTKYFGNQRCYISCPAPYFSSKVTMECVSTCPKGYWGDVNDPSRLCQVCHPERCEECYGPSFTQCSKCKIGFYLFQTSCDSCPIGYFKNDDTRTCDNCFSTCKECDGPSSSNCLSCNNDRYYMPTQKRCYDVCPAPYFSHFTLANCTLTCPTIQQFGNPLTRKCEDCNVACDQCSGGTYFDCKKCSALYYQYDKDKSCLLKCPDSTYAEPLTMKCQACDKSCATCKGGSNTDCVSCLLPNVLYEGKCVYDCPNSLYKDEELKECVQDCTKKFPNKYNDNTEMKCKQCHPFCSMCFGPTNAQCTKCKTSYLKDGTQCLQQCKSGTYLVSSKDKISDNDNDCKTCNSDCVECYGPQNTNCLSCSQSLYMLKNTESTISCLKTCPDLYIQNEQLKTCEQCPQKTYFYQGQCKQCYQTCGTCEGSFENECLSCVETRGDSKNQPTKGVCSCQVDYVETYKEKCDKASPAVAGVSTSVEVFAVTGSTASSLIGIIGRNMFFLYNILEIAQFTSYFRYVNINYPVSLDKLFDKLYISHISTFSSLNSNSNSQSSSNKTATSSRILEDTSYDQSTFLFDLRGKSVPLWKSFFILILLNLLSWLSVALLNVLVKYWKIKYNQMHLIEKVRCWITYSLPIQMFLRTSMEAILFIVLCIKNSSVVAPFDWIVCIYFMGLLGSTFFIILYQSKQPLRLNQENEAVILIKRVKSTKVSAIQEQKGEKDEPTYPHPFRTLQEFTRKESICRNFYLFHLIQKVIVVVVVVEFVSSAQKQILSFALVKTALFLLILVLRPLINKWYNIVTIFNEFMQAVICFVVYACTLADEDSQNTLGYVILILICVLFLVNLIGTLISLIFIIKNIIVKLIKNDKLKKINNQLNKSSDVLKPSRVQILSKNQKLDLSYLDDLNIDKSSSKSDSFQHIQDNSLVQPQKVNQGNGNTQEKSINNQSMYQYDYDSPFAFLEKQTQIDDQSRKQKKMQKRFTNKKTNQQQEHQNKRNSQEDISNIPKLTNSNEGQQQSLIKNNQDQSQGKLMDIQNESIDKQIKSTEGYDNQIDHKDNQIDHKDNQIDNKDNQIDNKDKLKDNIDKLDKDILIQDQNGNAQNLLRINQSSTKDIRFEDVDEISDLNMNTGISPYPQNSVNNSPSPFLIGKNVSPNPYQVIRAISAIPFKIDNCKEEEQQEHNLDIQRIDLQDNNHQFKQNNNSDKPKPTQNQDLKDNQNIISFLNDLTAKKVKQKKKIVKF